VQQWYRHALRMAAYMSYHTASPAGTPRHASPPSKWTAGSNALDKCVFWYNVTLQLVSSAKNVGLTPENSGRRTSEPFSYRSDERGKRGKVRPSTEALAGFREKKRGKPAILLCNKWYDG
jgi:hypothetical protein